MQRNALDDRHLPDGLSRRRWLRHVSLAVGGLGAAQVAAARESSGRAGLDTSVILLYLLGGPSHLETYDLKPDAPSEYRSIFRPIDTVVPGMTMCEHFPLQAKLADKIALVRSLNHDVDIHNDGTITVLTGKRPPVLDPSSTSVSQHPDFGMIASRTLGLHREAMPRYVAIPSPLGMLRTNYVGVEHQAFAAGDPAQPNYAPPQLRPAAGLDMARLETRRRLQSQFEQQRGTAHSPQITGFDPFHDVAMRMLANPRIADAFRLEQESEALRDRYGRHRWGQSCLLARRLAEAGSSVITVTINTPANGPDFTNWDDHADNAMRPGHFGMYMATRLPYYDQAISALIEDVYGRGLDRRIMIVAMGEFGRTPRISYRAVTGSTGRDHWPQAYSALVSGGGLRMGQVIGATSGKGERPIERPLTPQDILATVYRHLGVNDRHELIDFTVRPLPILPSGAPIAELVG